MIILPMAIYYPQLLLDICLVCGTGLLYDVSKTERRCNNCNIMEIDLEKTEELQMKQGELH